MRIEKVYNKVIDKRPKTLLERIKSAYSCGNRFMFTLVIMMMLMDILLHWILCFFQPAASIEPALNFKVKEYNVKKELYGDHYLNLLKNNKEK